MIPERWKGATAAEWKNVPDILLEHLEGCGVLVANVRHLTGEEIGQVLSLHGQAWRLPELVEALSELLEQVEDDPGVQVDGDLILKANRLLADIAKEPQA